MGEGQGPTGFERHRVLEAPFGTGGGGGFGKSERFKGPDGRPWAKWMVPDITQYNAITNPDLKTLVADLARKPDTLVDPTFLRNKFQKLEELRDAGVISDAEEALWGTRISDQAEVVQDLNMKKEASALAEAQGIVGPWKAIEEFRDGEEYLKPTEVISPGHEPRFWVLLNEEQKKQIYVRSTLMIIGYKKQMAPGTDKLYMDEMRELAVDLDKEAMKVIFKKEGVLAATGIYSTIIGDPKFLAYQDRYDDSLKSVFCSVVTKDPNVDWHRTKDKEEIERLKVKPTDSERVKEKKNRLNKKRLALKQFYSDDERRENRRTLKRDYGDDILTRDIEIGSENKVFDVKTYKGLEGLEKELRDGTPDSFYRHEDTYGTVIDRASFKVLKKAMRYWLVTEGRDLLLSDEEKKDREGFFGNLPDQFPSDEEKSRHKKKVFDELCARARDAEQIAWNFAYATSMLETFDSREFRPEGTSRHSPSFIWNLHIWVPMHPQERFEQKIRRTVRPEIVIKGERGTKVKVMKLTNLRAEAGEVQARREFEILDTRLADGKKWVKINYDGNNEGWIKENTFGYVPDMEEKEEWSVLGPVSLWNIQNGRFRDKDGKFSLPEDFKVLPNTLIRGPLFNSMFEEGREESASLYSLLNGIGNDVLYRTNIAAKADLFNRIRWSDVSDNAFVPFNFDEMRWADVVTNILKKGTFKKSKVDGQDFSEAVRNLRLGKRERDLLLICYYGVNPRSTTLAPSSGWMKFNDYKGEFLKIWPNYYSGPGRKTE